MGIFAGLDEYGRKTMWHASSSRREVEYRVFSDTYEKHSEGLYAHHYGTNERFAW